MFIVKTAQKELFFNYERVRGIEPLSSAWKANIMNHYTIPALVKSCFKSYKIIYY